MNTRPKLLALTAILLLTCLLLAEDDICNMELVSTWNSPPAYGISELSVEIDEKDSILYFANSDELYILSSSAIGELTLIDSLNITDAKFTQVVDNLLFTYHSGEPYGSYVHDISYPADPESISIVHDINTYHDLFVEDSIMCLRGSRFLNIANPESIITIGTTFATTKYLDFDSMYSYETYWIDHSTWPPDPPGSRIESFFRLRKFVGYDSSYVVLDTNLWGGVYSGICTGNLVVKDTLVFIYLDPA